MDVVYGIKILFAALGGFLGWFLGGLDPLIIMLVAFVVCDYITGVMVAITKKTLSSSTGFYGLCRKIMIFIIVGIASVIDYNLFPDTAAIRTATIFFYVANEGISILENASLLGVKFPKKMEEVFLQMKEREHENE